MKGGLVFADRLCTVSPTYAEEIKTPFFGENLDGLLRARKIRSAAFSTALTTTSSIPLMIAS